MRLYRINKSRCYFRFARFSWLGLIHWPISLFIQHVIFKDQHWAWLKFMNLLKHCLVGKDTLKGKILKKTVMINFSVKSTILHYGLNFRGKEQFLITESIIERLDPDAVAAKDKFFLLGIPHGNSKHPIKFDLFTFSTAGIIPMEVDTHNINIPINPVK